MMFRNRLPQTADSAKRPARAVAIAVATLMVAATMLGGCVVEEPGYYHHGGWGWHHHDRD
jgi:hypothetical protein